MTVIGPYVYQQQTEKFNIEFQGSDQVSFEVRTQYSFRADLSAPGVSEQDQLVVLNNGIPGGAQLFYFLLGLPFDQSAAGQMYDRNHSFRIDLQIYFLLHSASRECLKETCLRAFAQKRVRLAKPNRRRMSVQACPARRAAL